MYIETELHLIVKELNEILNSHILLIILSTFMNKLLFVR